MQILDIVIVVALIILIGGLVRKVYKLRKLRGEVTESMPDEEEEVDMQTIREVVFRGHSMQFTDHEVMEWNKMNRKQKRYYVEKQKEAIKSGRYVNVQRPDGGYAFITKKEAVEKGVI